MRTVEKGLTVKDLEIHKLGLLDRIKRIQLELRAPVDIDKGELSGQTSNQIILKRLLEIEKSNLVKINYELGKKIEDEDKLSG